MRFALKLMAAAAFTAAVSLFGQTPPDVSALLDARNYSEALRVLSASTASPALLGAWQRLGRLCPPREVQCSQTAWQNVLRFQPQDPEARFSLAAVYERQRNYQESNRQLDLMPASEINRPGTLVLRCSNLAALGKPKEALAAAQKAVASAEFIRPDAAWLLPRLGTPELAPIVVTFVETFVSRQEAAVDDRRLLVTAYEALNRWKEARATLESLAVDQPSNAEHLFELARVAYVERDFEGALGYLGHARDLVPGEARVHFLFGLMLVQLNLPPEARKSLEKAVELAPDNPDYRYALGSVILRARDPSPAIDCFRRYIQARPGDPKGTFALGIATFLSGAYEESATLMRAARENPATKLGALYFLGRIARLDGQTDEAGVFFEECIRERATFPQGWAELGRIRVEQRRYDDAHKTLARALELEPDNFQANSTLLALYQREHDPRAAEQAIRLRTLDEERSKQQDLMLRGIEVKPY
jgi:tetratricopeptide (TPR) repeat protein